MSLTTSCAHRLTERGPAVLRWTVPLAIVLAPLPGQALPAAGAHAHPADAFGPALPYLQDGRPGQVTIVWRPAQPAPTRVIVHDDFGHAVFDRVVTTAPQPEVTVTGLQPGVHYEYEVKPDGQPPFSGRFIANRGPDAPNVRFAVIGDMGDGSSSQFAVARELTRWAPEIFLTVGDNVYPNASRADYGPRFFVPYGPLMSTAVCYPTLGNHDIHTENGAPFLEAFALPREPAGGRYYAFDDGPARFWCLDSNESLAPGSPQYEWLAADAAASTARWKLAFFHHPPYSSGLHGQEAKNRRWLPALFSRLGFQAVFTGHDHHYERSVPIGGVTYIVTGGGGATLYGTTQQPFTATKAVRHEFVAASISGDQLGLMAIDENGHVLDAACIHQDRR